MVTEGFRELYPFQSNFLQIEGCRLHYLDEGEGKPILMLHGNPTWSFFYRNIVSAFKYTNRCVAPDHIGCGFSDKPQDYPYTLSTHIDNVEKLIDYLGLENITLLLHDWGGAIGLGLAVRRPEQIKKIIILNTAAFLDPHIPLSINLCRIPIFGDIVIRGFNAFALGALVRAIKCRNRLTSKVRNGYLLPYDSWKNRIAHLRFVQDIPMNMGVSSYSVVVDIHSRLKLFKNHPIMICWGMQDFCFCDHFLQRWKRIFPNASIHEFPHAGHYVLEDAYEEIILKMKTFLGKNIRTPQNTI